MANVNSSNKPTRNFKITPFIFKKFDVSAEMDMRARVSQLNLQKSPLQPVLNDIFLRKPKRHGGNDIEDVSVDLV